MSEIVLKLSDVHKTYGKRKALQGVSFSIKRGERIGLLGQNGAGKSTTLKILCSLIKRFEGNVELLSQDLRKSRASLRNKIGAMIEAPAFYPQLNAVQNLFIYKSAYGISENDIVEAIKAVGLHDDIDVPFGNYSMGMKQRLGLAGAFVHKPDFIILDEPTNGLDPVVRMQIHKIILELGNTHNMTALICSHMIDEVDALCSRALVIEKGRIILDQNLTDTEDGIDKVKQTFANISEVSP